MKKTKNRRGKKLKFNFDNMRNLCEFCHYHRGGTKEKAIKIGGSLLIATAILLWSLSTAAGVSAKKDIDLVAKFIPEPAPMSLAAIAEEIPTAVLEDNGDNEKREKFEKERQTQEVNQWKKDRLREVNDLLRQIKQLRAQIARIKGASESLGKLEAIKSGVIEFVDKIKITQDADDLRALLEDTDFSDWWEEMNILQAAVQIPKDLNNLRRDQKRALATLKQKWICKVVDCAKFNQIIQNMNGALDEATRLYQTGELEDARNAIQETFHERGWYGDALGAVQMMRGFVEPFKKIHDQALLSQLNELIDPVKELLYEGEVRDARESMDEIQRELGPGIFKLIMDAQNKRRAVPDKILEKIQKMQERLEISPQAESSSAVPAVPATPYPGEGIPATPATPAEPAKPAPAPESASCVGPYHVLASDGRCVWSCSAGTTPGDNNQCVCKEGYAETGTDQFGRRICAQSVPVSSEIKIFGRLIDRATKQPLPNIYVKTDGMPASLSTNDNGEFVFILDANTMTAGAPKGFSFWPNCHIGRGGRIDKDASGNIKVMVDVFDLVYGYDNYTFPYSGQSINLGDIPQWPAVDINVASDVPVKLNIEYPEEKQGSGNALYKTSHTLARVIPIEYDASVKLTNETGTTFNSPPARYKLSQWCNAVKLNFKGGEFQWDPTP